MLKSINELKIIVDHRELKGRVVEELFKQKVQLDIRQLSVADYIVSDKVAFELKDSKDFEASIIDGRLFKQCEELIDNYQKPVIIIVGDYITGRVHPNAVRGAIASITTDYNIPIITVKNAEEAAKQIIAYARREQGTPNNNPRIPNKKKIISDEQAKEAMIAAAPMIGIKLAKELLTKFGSVKKIINATIKELTEVNGIGIKKAEALHKIINNDYKNLNQ